MFLSVKDFLCRERVPCILVCVLFMARLLVLVQLGPMYSIESDDLSYVKSGIHLANTGMLVMHAKTPSAQIMPGLPAVIALASLVLGECRRLWLGLELLWIAMGSMAGWFLYKSARLFVPTWCAVLAVLPLLRPDFLLIDNVILTETPFTLCFTALIYFTFMMGRSDKKRYFVGCAIAYFAALFLRANIGPYPIFAGLYLLGVRYSFKKLLRQGLILAGILLCLLTPWTIRNYIQFDAFIPLTHGAGNPALLGTYQGRGYPEDDELDYATNVDEVVRERYAKYYNDDGTVPERYQQYVNLGADGVKAAYRMRVWRETNPRDFYLSYIVLKPLRMMNDVFYVDTLWNITIDMMVQLQRKDTLLCVCALIILLISRVARPQMLYLLGLYMGNVWLYCTTFAYGRYNISLMPARFLFISLGLYGLTELIKRLRRLVRDKI